MALVPILVYHSIAREPLPLIRDFAIDERRFADHLDRVAVLDLRALTMSAYLDALDRRDDALLERSVVITFDDGFADFRTAALPAMAERGLVSTLYVATGLLPGGPDAPVDDGIASHMLDWPQLAGLREAGVAIDAPVDTFAYPHGYSSARVRRLVRDAGFRGACGVKNALSSPRDDRFALA